MAKQVKHGTKYTGVRYTEHPTRKHGRVADKYFYIRYPLNKTTKEEGLGWASEDWTADKAHAIRSQLRQAQKTGRGPKSLAEMRMGIREEQRIAAQKVEAEKASTMTLAEFFETHYMPHAKKSKRSWRNDKAYISNRINPALGHLPLLAVKKSHVQNFADQLSESGLAPATVKLFVAVIRRAYNIASEISENEVPLFSGQNPAKLINLPAISNARERFLTASEAELLISAAAELPSRTLHDAIVLSLNTGLRVGEISRLTWFEVDFVTNFITVREEAMRKPGGKVPMNEAARELLAARKAEMDVSATDLVFQSTWEKGFQDEISQKFALLVKEVGLNEGLAPDDRARRVVFHTLRHTFASWLAINGVDIYRIKTLMRHKTLEMTMRYAHLIPEATQEAVNGLTHARSSR